MSLLVDHEEHLATSLEDSAYWGVPIKFTSPDNQIEFTINGQVNKISRMAELYPSDDVAIGRVNCTVRLSTVLAQLGQPTRNWKAETTPQPGIVPIGLFLIEESGFNDDQLGVITYTLTEIEKI